MGDRGRDRERGVVLVVIGTIVLFFGMAGILGLECTTVSYNCPGGGCVPRPYCPTVLDNVVSVALVLAGVAMVVPGSVLVRRPKTS